MTSLEFFTVLTLVLYTAGTFLGIGGMVRRSKSTQKLGTACMMLGFAAQTAFMAMGSHSALPEGLSFGAYLQLIAWFLVLGGMAGWLKLRSVSPLFFTSPLALIFFCMAMPFQQQTVHLPQQLAAPFYALHIGSLFIAIGLMALGCGAGLLFMLLERSIKNKTRMKGFWQDLPALSLLDTINTLAVYAGFPLYTLGIVAGYLWAKPVFGVTLSADPKELFTLLIWGLFATIFHNRLIYGWKGRKPALFMIILFALSVFSLVVINLYFNTHHSIMRQ